MLATIRTFFNEDSIAVSKYGFKIASTAISREGNVLEIHICWEAPLNDGYFLFKTPKLEYGLVVFPEFNKAHRGAAKFYLDVDVHNESSSDYLDKIVKIGCRCSKDGATFYFQIPSKNHKELATVHGDQTYFPYLRIK